MANLPQNNASRGYFAVDDCNDHIAQFVILNLKSDCAAEFFVRFILRVLKKIENVNMCCCAAYFTSVKICEC